MKVLTDKEKGYWTRLNYRLYIIHMYSYIIVYYYDNFIELKDVIKFRLTNFYECRKSIKYTVN